MITISWFMAPWFRDLLSLIIRSWIIFSSWRTSSFQASPDPLDITFVAMFPSSSSVASKNYWINHTKKMKKNILRMIEEEKLMVMPRKNFHPRTKVVLPRDDDETRTGWGGFDEILSHHLRTHRSQEKVVAMASPGIILFIIRRIMMRKSGGDHLMIMSYEHPHEDVLVHNLH